MPQSVSMIIIVVIIIVTQQTHSDAHVSHKNHIIIVIISVYIQGHKKRFRLKNILFAKQSALLVCSGFTQLHEQLQQSLQPSSKVSVSTTSIRYVSSVVLITYHS